MVSIWSILVKLLMNFLQLVYATHHTDVYPSLSLPPECLPLAPICHYDLKALKRLRSFKCVQADDIPGFIIKGCTDISYLYLFLSIHVFLIYAYLRSIFLLYGSKRKLFLFKKEDKRTSDITTPILVAS
jgi:hypothetical protein